MKKIGQVAIILSMLLFSSCVDIEERYSFNADGSCKVIYGFDMSKALSVLTHLMSDSIKSTAAFSASKDTVLNYYSALPDSIRSTMQAEDVNLAKATDLAVKMNLRQSKMQVTMSHLAHNPAELEDYLKSIAKMSVDSHLGQIEFAEKGNIGSAANAKKGDVPLIAGQDYYVYEIKPGRFRRVVDKIKFRAFLKKAESNLVMAKAMLIDMPYRLVLNFARPVKKVSNPKAVLSADRRSVTLETDMDEIIRNPAILNLQVDF